MKGNKIPTLIYEILANGAAKTASVCGICLGYRALVYDTKYSNVYNIGGGVLFAMENYGKNPKTDSGYSLVKNEKFIKIGSDYNADKSKKNGITGLKFISENRCLSPLAQVYAKGAEAFFIYKNKKIKYKEQTDHDKKQNKQRRQAGYFDSGVCAVANRNICVVCV
jgi:hypothetical protein